jgi:hypothetical protein
MKRVALLLAFAFNAEAGLFLDLDLGVHLVDYHVHLPDDPSKQYLSHENPIGMIRLGYETKAYPVGKIDVRLHTYYEHGSSLRSADYGYHVWMGGIRLE